MTLTLSIASSGQLTDTEATGTIANHDPLPRALVARFGRTAAVHVAEHVEARIEALREPGFRGRLAGQELRRTGAREWTEGNSMRHEASLRARATRTAVSASSGYYVRRSMRAGSRITAT